MKKIILIILLMFSFLLPVNAAEMEISAKSAILIDQNTGKVLYKKNENEKLAMASMTKIMSLLLIMEKIDEGVIKYDDIVEIRRIDESVNRMPGSENVYIFHGRDVYAYTAAKLASGIISYNEVGPQYSLDEITILPLTNIKAEVKEGYACGGIYNFDVAYGCCRVNIYNKDFQNIGKFQYGDIVNVTISAPPILYPT